MKKAAEILAEFERAYIAGESVYSLRNKINGNLQDLRTRAVKEFTALVTEKNTLEVIAGKETADAYQAHTDDKKAEIQERIAEHIGADDKLWKPAFIKQIFSSDRANLIRLVEFVLSHEKESGRMIAAAAPPADFPDDEPRITFLDFGTIEDTFRIFDVNQLLSYVMGVHKLYERADKPGADRAALKAEHAALPKPAPLWDIAYSPTTQEINRKYFTRTAREGGINWGQAVYGDLLQFVQDYRLNAAEIKRAKAEKEAEQLAQELDVVTQEYERLKAQQPAEQLAFFPTFAPQKSAYFNRALFNGLFNPAKIRAEHLDKLETKLENGLTVDAQLTHMENWVNDLSLKDIENYVLLFAYVQNIKQFIDENPGLNCEFIERRPGEYQGRTKANNDFYRHFLERDNKGAHEAPSYLHRDKQALLNWLYVNQAERDILMADEGGKIRLRKIWIYRIITEVATINKAKEIDLWVNLNILEICFQDYLKIDRAIFRDIDRALEKYADDPEYKRHNKQDYISNYHDLIIKFYLVLKTIYNQAGTATKGPYVFNTQTLTAKHLDERLGNLKERVRLGLKKRNTISSDSSKTIDVFNDYLLKFIFSIAVYLKWLRSLPKYARGTFTFHINAGHFAPKDTAETLKVLRGHKKAALPSGTN